MQVSWEKCKKSLAMVWFSGSGIIFLLLIIQSNTGRYPGFTSEVWEWFLPTIMPTLSLIIGVLVLDASEKSSNIKTIDRFLFRLSLSLSIVYLVVVAQTILIKPFTLTPALDLMKQSNLWLGPLQGLVAASLGAFFICGKRD